MKKLNKKQLDFAKAYMGNGRNGTEAAIMAGYSANGARARASRLLKNPLVMDFIGEVRQVAVDKSGASQAQMEIDLLERIESLKAQLVAPLNEAMIRAAAGYSKPVITTEVYQDCVGKDEDGQPAYSTTKRKVTTTEKIYPPNPAAATTLLNKDLKLTRAIIQCYEQLSHICGWRSGDDSNGQPIQIICDTLMMKV